MTWPCLRGSCLPTIGSPTPKSVGPAEGGSVRSGSVLTHYPGRSINRGRYYSLLRHPFSPTNFEMIGDSNTTSINAGHWYLRQMDKALYKGPLILEQFLSNSNTLTITQRLRSLLLKPLHFFSIPGQFDSPVPATRQALPPLPPSYSVNN